MNQFEDNHNPVSDNVEMINVRCSVCKNFFQVPKHELDQISKERNSVIHGITGEANTDFDFTDELGGHGEVTVCLKADRDVCLKCSLLIIYTKLLELIDGLSI